MNKLKPCIIFIITTQLLVLTVPYAYGYLRFTDSNDYLKKVNKLCPDELENNEASKFDLYLNHTNIHIKKSIEQKFFTHCGAWCLFDHRNPIQGWFWTQELNKWVFHEELYHLCPAEEFHYAIKRYVYLCSNEKH